MQFVYVRFHAVTYIKFCILLEAVVLIVNIAFTPLGQLVAYNRLEITKPSRPKVEAVAY